MADVMIVGCGDLGGEVARLLVKVGHKVKGIRRRFMQPSSNGVQWVQADVTDKASLAILKNLSPDIIIYCVAASQRSDESYRQHYVAGLRYVLEAQEKNGRLQHIFFISSTRVYGQQVTGYLDESMQAEANDFGGKRLLEAESLLQTAKCNTTALRLSGIYAANRLYLLKMSQDVNRWPKNNQWTNRIHRDDAAQFIVLICEKALRHEAVESCYIVTDDEPSLQYDVLHWLASMQGLAVAASAPLTEGGKRLSNQRLKSTGFQLKYPNYKIGYGKILQHI